MTEPGADRVDVNAGAKQVTGTGMAQGLLILLMIYTQQKSVTGFIPSMASKLKSFVI